MVAVQRRTLATLVGSQSFGGIGVTIGVAATALLAKHLTGSPAQSGLAQTTQVLGSAVAAVLLARVMHDHGRRRGLVTGYVVGAVGGLACGVAAIVGSFALLLLGAAMMGATTASNGHARYAAVDLARPSRRGWALSVVVWATTVGAVAGPTLTGPAGQVATALGYERLSGPFLFGSLGMAISAVVMVLFLRPDPLLTARRFDGATAPRAKAAGAWGRARACMRERPVLAAATACMSLAHAVMVAVMVMTPLHMDHGGASLEIIGVVISLHVFGMFGLSPLVGWAADRWGPPPVMVAGAVILGAAVTLAGVSHAGTSWQITAGLIALGVGWACATVASAALIAAHTPPHARTDVQGVADAVMGVAAAAAGALAGVIVAVSGFAILNAFAGFLAATAAVSAVWARREAGGPSSRTPSDGAHP